MTHGWCKNYYGKEILLHRENGGNDSDTSEYGRFR